MKYDSDYWALLAQIIPVVMIALVVEGRFFSRQLARKSSFDSNGALRVFYAATFTLISLGLLVGFNIALQGARGGGLNRVGRLIVESSLALGVSTVFLSPVLGVCIALVGDKVTEAHRRMPYSAKSRRRRQQAADSAELQVIGSEYRSVLLWARGQVVSAYLGAYRAYRESSGSDEERRALEGELVHVDLLHEFVVAWNERFAEKFKAAEERLKTADALISDSERDEFRRLLRLSSGM